MDLVIVESPAKANVINKYLGVTYKVVSSYGHIRDLPSENGSVEPDKDFLMHYEITPKSIKNVKIIVDLAKKADKIFLATDPDREGEAISWHVVEMLKQKKVLKKNVEIKRIVFHEITKAAVQKAMENPRDVSIDLVNAQQARRALDYLVGFTLSPILWRKLPGSRSAGRVQSVALRFICEREAEIEKFISQEYWSIKCLLNSNGTDFLASLVTLQNKKLDKLDLGKQSEVDPIVERLRKAEYVVDSIEKKQHNRNPYPPLITSTLQQEAFNRLGFTAKKTMTLAQGLYEGIHIGADTVGLITYMRTDGTQLAPEAVQEARSYIGQTFGDKYLPSVPRSYKTKVKNAQEAHEAIRPTSVARTPDSMRKYLDKDQFALYQLIWRRMLACQMASAVFDQVVVMISTKDGYAGLKATGSTILFDGFYKVYGRDEENDTILPELANGDKLKLQDVIPTQHFTEPPPRYSEASLIKQLEEMGIGRPSTYASIISVLLDRKYVKIDKKRFVPEDRGRLVTAFLKHFFKKYVEYGFTASLEDKLDLISDNKLEWKQMLGEFWKDFSKTSEDVSKHTIDQVLEGIVPEIEAYVFPPNADGSDPKLCHECKKHQLHIRIGKFGPFIACNGYPECKYTRALHDDEASSDPEASHEAQAIGIDPVSQQSILLKHGPFGSYLEVQDGERLKRVHVPDVFKKDIHDINVAVRLLSLPREVGVHPETGESIKTNIGKFGPYLLYNKKFTSLQNIDQVFNINLSDALKVIAAGSANGKELGGYKGEQVTLNKGRFGPYIKFGKINVKVPKGTDLGQIDLEQAKQFIENHKK